MTGAGFENAQVYQNITVEFMGIGNIHTQRENLKKLVQTCKVKEEETRRESREGKKGREAWQRREARKRSEEKRKEREREKAEGKKTLCACSFNISPLLLRSQPKTRRSTVAIGCKVSLWFSLALCESQTHLSAEFRWSFIAGNEWRHPSWWWHHDD